MDVGTFSASKSNRAAYDLAHAKANGLKAARKAFAETGKLMEVEVSIRVEGGWMHYTYTYDNITDSLIQDKSTND